MCACSACSEQMRGREVWSGPGASAKQADPLQAAGASQPMHLILLKLILDSQTHLSHGLIFYYQPAFS
jgi:hypothetical protein